MIKKFNFKTPGREDEKTDEVVVDEVAVDSQKSRPHTIIDAFGGKGNIVDLDNCATRLRVTVKDPELVKKNAFPATGSKGVIMNGTGVQVVYGPQVSVIKNEIEEILEQ
ncbi:PTS system, maltose and glucose-specific IIC component [Planococcus sp. PAMC 21323]|uniref:glucose PTS transporter subunit EIIB n=1 Tax=Planococcus sp. PAMC 21323 TaxID=1526927 RepID=UPI00057049AE|nr:glucose PTS transporter subunit EIIB [Planococcus sp. PAMC 21323]AIY06789.1 PTS system, maltose and glucose-specific IIC component [Planococcus sp. PAMC 21323]